MVIEKKSHIVELRDVAIGTPFMRDNNSLCIKIASGDIKVEQEGSYTCLVLDFQYNTLKVLRGTEKVELVNAKIVVE